MMKCKVCGRPINGRYITALGQNWHPECFRCAACGKVIEGSFMDKNKHPYHADCYHKHFSPRCAGCGKPISGRMITALDKIWHPECFACVDCGKQLNGGFYTKRGKIYCEEHYNERFADRCVLCNKPLKGEYIVDYWGNKFCAAHQDMPHCFCCGRVISQRVTGGGEKMADKRSICRICLQSVVYDNDEALEVFEQVRAYFAEMGLKLPELDFPVRLVKQGELRKKSTHLTEDARSDGLAVTQTTYLNGAETKRKVEEILALNGLPREHLANVLAHELGHAWLFLNWFPKLPLKLEEGLCGLFEYLWLSGQKTKLAKYRIKCLKENKDRVYGTGFRSVFKAYKRYSLSDLLNYVRETGKLPRSK